MLEEEVVILVSGSRTCHCCQMRLPSLLLEAVLVDVWGRYDCVRIAGGCTSRRRGKCVCAGGGGGSGSGGGSGGASNGGGCGDAGVLLAVRYWL